MPPEATILKKPDSIRHDARSIQTDLQRRITSRDWMPGDKLPSRRSLATEYGVALATIERACAKLIDTGVLTATGRGTLVSEPVKEASIVRQITGTDPLKLLGKSIGVINVMECIAPGHIDGNGWTVPVISSLEGAIAKMGGRTQQYQPTMENVLFGDACDALLSRGVDAIVVIGMSSSVRLDNEFARRKLSQSIYVCITGYDLNLPAPAVFFDNWTAGYQAAEHALQVGATRLVYIGPQNRPWAAHRLEGAAAAASYSTNGGGLTVIRSLDDVGVWPYSEEDLIQQVAALLDVENGNYRDCGIIAANDSIAVAAKVALSRRGLQAGRDYYVTGFDNAPQSRAADMTTFRPPLEELGIAAADLVSDYVRGETRSTKASLRCQLIVRGSTTREPAVKN